MRKLLSFTLASVMLMSAVACTKNEPVKTSSSASAAETFLVERLGAVPEGVILGDAEVAASYGVDMTDFDSEGFVVRTVGDKTLVFGKTEDGLDRAARYYANYVYGNPSPVDKVYGEGARLDCLTVCGIPIADFVITVTDEHPEGSYPESTEYAATELSSFIKQATGVTVPVVDEAEGKPYIRLTCDGSGDNGEEGFTITVTEDGNVEILGGLKRGCLYAVYDIAEKWLGMRFLSYDYTHIYEQGAVNITPDDSYADAPKMSGRNIYNTAINPGTYGFSYGETPVRNKQNGVGTYAKYGYVSTQAASHGMWEFWGTGAMDANLCMNDEELNELVVERVGNKLEAAKQSGALYQGNYYHVNLGLNDSESFCYCEACLEVTKEEGSYSGNLVRLQKYIAETFASDYPEARFGILAYLGTEKPCKTKLPDNAFVTYCIVGSCYGGPMDGSECREDRYGKSGFTVAEEKENFQGWKEVTDNVSLWYYYFSDRIGAPNNVLRNMYIDTKYLYEIGVRSVFVEFEHTAFSYDIPGAWLLSKLLWDPEMPEEEFLSLRDEIMELTYGDGYTYIRDQLDIWDSFYPCTDRKFWGVDLDIEKVKSETEYLLHVYGEAERLATSERTENNVRLLKTNVLFNAICVWYEDMKINGTAKEKEYYNSLMAELKDIFTEFGLTHLSFWVHPDNVFIPDIDWETDPNTWIGLLKSWNAK